MDARSKANFINAVAGGQSVPCPRCNAMNKATAKFCVACGAPLARKEEDSAVPFAPAKRAEPAPPETAEKTVRPAVEYQEPESVFAEGLPDWDIEPPQVVVRRKRK